jgi:hypothetical protein
MPAALVYLPTVLSSKAGYSGEQSVLRMRSLASKLAKRFLRQADPRQRIAAAAAQALSR